MDIWHQQTRIQDELSRRLIHDVEVHGLNNEIVLHGRNNECAKGTYNQILEVIQKATDYDSLWAECANASLLWPDHPDDNK